ncbi:glycosyltransferase family 76 protein [Lophiostoma macrostomum CBS 122681]|uniref:GPI mannosyltransferase 2 n=1 Tax=Lophiostoma macrostomum CBS 122681 TaxID=1314788 RepID=A0A6A6TKJ2_9PLEO|nr:glycosyltransferase family 76 protein [Lophiostoma macrostomum CBS 122681]
MSPTSASFATSQDGPLVWTFVAWKSFLTLLTALCPGPGYDTSGLVLFGEIGHRHAAFPSSSYQDRIALNLFRWDSLYFVMAAKRGYRYEQEWAFSWAYSKGLGALKDFVFGPTEDHVKYYIWSGFIVSNLFHLLSVLVLYRLIRRVMPPRANNRIALVTAILHVFSPAGLFLTAPYTESLFAALNFTGMLHYVLAKQASSASGAWTLSQDAYMLSSGAFFGLATLVRSNGLLSGVIFLFEVACSLPSFLTWKWELHDLRRTIITCVAGCFLFVGFVTPQVIAYQEYCASSDTTTDGRPWCEKQIPSIYSWVQRHYWNVGFLRYWTLSNLPLFLAAAPMLWLLSVSSLTVLREVQRRQSVGVPACQSPGALGQASPEAKLCAFPQLALPQLALAVTAATTFHVQIINRIASGYPIWYMVIAEWIVNQSQNQEKSRSSATFRWMFMYAIIQGVLFANFLPPA